MKSYRLLIFGVFLLFIWATGVLLFLETAFLKSKMEDAAENSALTVANYLSSTFMMKYDWDLSFLQDQVLREEFDREMRSELGALGLEKVEVYDLDGVILYSADPKLIGLRVPTDRFLQTALNGEPTSGILISPPYVNLYGDKISKELIETYVPIKAPGEEIIGTFKISQNYAPFRVIISQGIRRLAGVILVYMLIFTFLIGLFVTRQNEILLSQKNRILKELEDEVATKTTQLIRSAKLATLGLMSSKIGHEIRNALNEIVGYGSMLKGALEGREADYYRGMMAATSRIEAIAKDLLVVGASSEPSFQEVTIIDQIDDVARFLSETSRQLDNCPLVARYLSRGIIQGIPDQIRQIFLNLLINASQAMESIEEGGEIRVTVEEIEAEDQVRVEVKDSGPGIPPDAMERIFDPFYTTKPEGKGTGLGLAVVREIVEHHHGSITAESPPGEGAVFEIRFPRFRKSLIEKKPVSKEPTPR